MNKLKIEVLFVILALIVSGNSFAQSKRAQAGMKFLSVANSAKISGIGEAATAIEGRSESMFFNPAGMARQTNMVDVTLGQTEWIADIKYLYGSASFSLFDGKYGIFGVTITTVDYGTLNRTIRSGSDGYTDLGTYSPTALSAGLGYAKALSDKFAVGGNIKYVRQSFGEHVTSIGSSGEYQYEKFEKDVMAFDFGILYHTGWKSLLFGMSIRNFSEEIKYIDESFQLPLTFKIGFSFDLIDLTDFNKDDHSLMILVDASHPRDYDEQLNLGMQYTIFNAVSFRAGYITPSDEQGLNAGVGFNHTIAGVNIGFDYAYTDFGIFDNLHRFTVTLGY